MAKDKETKPWLAEIREFIQHEIDIIKGKDPRRNERLDEMDAIMDRFQFGRSNAIDTLKEIAAYEKKWDQETTPWLWHGRHGQPLFPPEQVRRAIAFLGDDAPNHWSEKLAEYEKTKGQNRR
jgi:hypothetical protein